MLVAARGSSAGQEGLQAYGWSLKTRIRCPCGFLSKPPRVLYFESDPAFLSDPAEKIFVFDLQLWQSGVARHVDTSVWSLQSSESSQCDGPLGSCKPLDNHAGERAQAARVPQSKRHSLWKLRFRGSWFGPCSFERDRIPIRFRLLVAGREIHFRL